MILNIIKSKCLEEYKILLTFNDGKTKVVDLKKTIFNDQRPVFSPLKDQAYFKNFEIHLNTITWENEADFAPEYLYDLGIEITPQQVAA